MTQKVRQPLLAPNLDDAITQKINEPATNVRVRDTNVTVRRARLTLSGFTVAVLAANDYGGAKLCDLPDTNLMILGVEADCVITKAGTTNGIVAATDLDVGIGTAAATNATLATTMIDVVAKVDIDDNALEVDFEVHSNDQSTTPVKIADGASSALYLNIATGNITADDSISVSGTIDLFYIDLGNIA